MNLILKKFQISNSIIILDKNSKDNVEKSIRNIPNIKVTDIKRRSNINFFVFHFSSSIMQTLRNFFMKFLVKRKSFVNSYLGKVYKN